MKLRNLTKGVIVFSVLSMLASGALIASAASDTNPASATNSAKTVNKNHGRGFFGETRIKPADLTDAQKAEMETKKAAREAKRTEMEAKLATVKAALTAADYTAWVAAEKAVDENSPLLAKITADNFNKYVEANNFRAQADAIMKDLGIAGPDMARGLGGPGRGGFSPDRGGDFGPGDESSQK